MFITFPACMFARVCYNEVLYFIEMFCVNSNSSIVSLPAAFECQRMFCLGAFFNAMKYVHEFYVTVNLCLSGVRLEEFIYEKVQGKRPILQVDEGLLGQYMVQAGNQFDAGTPYGMNCLLRNKCSILFVHVCVSAIRSSGIFLLANIDMLVIKC